MINPVTAAASSAVGSGAGSTGRASAPLTPFQVDQNNYGDVGAVILGGVRAVGEAAEATYDATLGRLASGIAQAAGPVVDGAESLAAQVGEGIAAASDKVVTEALDAYHGVAELAGDAAHATKVAYDAVSEAASTVADGVNEVAGDVAGYALQGVAMLVD